MRRCWLKVDPPLNEVFQERKLFQFGDDIGSKYDYTPPPHSKSVTKFRGNIFLVKSEKKLEAESEREDEGGGEG